MRIYQTELTAVRSYPSGGWRVSGYGASRLFLGYTKREAVRLMAQYLNGVNN